MHMRPLNPKSARPLNPQPLDERAKHLELGPVPTLTAETLPTTFGVFVHEVYFPHALSTLRPSTVRLYRERWRTRLEPAFGALTWSQITPMRVLQWITTLARESGRTPPFRLLAPRTVKQAHDTLSGMLQLAFLCGLLPSNPARQVREAVPASKPAAFKRGQPKRLRADDVIRLLICQAVPLYRRVEIAFSVYTACRPGEVRAARWEWLNWRDGIAYVHVQETDDHGTTKTGESREVPLHAELVDILTMWREQWTKHFDRAPRPDDYLFPNWRDGSMRSPDHTHFRNLLRRAAVPEITPHGLRHTGAQLLRDVGCPQSDIGAILGHVDSSTTAVYADATLSVLLSWIRRVFLLGPNAGRRMLASRPPGPVCDQPMQPLTLSRGALSGQCRPLDFDLSTRFTPMGTGTPGHHCTSAPLRAKAKAKAPSSPSTAGVTRGSFEGAILVVLTSPATSVGDDGARTPDAARFPVRGPEEALRLARAIYLREAGWRLEVLDDAGEIIASREGPDPVPTRRDRRKDGAS